MAYSDMIFKELKRDGWSIGEKVVIKNSSPCFVLDARRAWGPSVLAEGEDKLQAYQNLRRLTKQHDSDNGQGAN